MIPKDLRDQYLCLQDSWALLGGYVGSRAHGTWMPPTEPTSIDDKDVMVITVPPVDHFFGLKEFGSRGTLELKRDEWDIVVYEIRKAFRLLLQGNPNILSLLWLPENCYIRCGHDGDLLLKHRDFFSGKHVYRSFVGYAYGQLHRMTHGAFEGFMGAKRKALVERFGYDTKNAAHLIRILRMGIEFLATGELNVLRPDAAQLKEIKRGEWALDAIKKEADKLFVRAEEALIQSKLPPGPNFEKANRLCVHILRRFHG